MPAVAHLSVFVTRIQVPLALPTPRPYGTWQRRDCKEVYQVFTN